MNFNLTFGYLIGKMRVWVFASFSSHLRQYYTVCTPFTYDRYAPRWDCGSEYEICVQLLGAKKKHVLKTFRPDKVTFQQWNDQKWSQVTHVFKNYGRGVRYIRFMHGGKDTQFWAGWYGIRVTNSSVEICPAGER